MQDRATFYIFISGYWALVLAVLGVGALVLGEGATSIPLLIAAAIFGALWVWGRKL